MWLRNRYGRYIIHKTLSKNVKDKTDGPPQPGTKPTYHEQNLVCGSLNIDGNALLHPAAATAGNGIPEDIFEVFIGYIEDANLLLKPKKLRLAFDGVAPAAKMKQQWIRRYLGARGISTEEEPQWDSALLTPGTNVMDKIDSLTRVWLKTNSKSIPKDTTYFPHRLSGEGEHKLFEGGDIVRQAPSLGGGGKNNKNQANVMYANDNDLIILCLLRGDNWFLMRESLDKKGDIDDPENPPEEGAASGKSPRTNFDFVDIESLKFFLKRDYDITPEDFSIVVLLAGNDFVPTTPVGYNVDDTLDAALKLYKALREKKPKLRTKKGTYEQFRLYKDDSIHWDDLYLFITQLAKYEEKLLIMRRRKEKVSIERAKTAFLRDYYVPPPIQETVMLKDFYSFAGKEEFLNMDKVRDYYYNDMFPGLKGTPLYGHVLLDVVDAYLESFVWSTIYYTRGVEFVNVEWCYRYNKAPLLSDVAAVLELRDVDSSRWTRNPLMKGNKLLNPLEQQVAVLPLGTLNKVLYGTYTISDQVKNVIYKQQMDKYPELVYIDQEGRNIPEKAIVELPNIDLNRVRKIAKDIDRPDIAAKENKPVRFPFAQFRRFNKKKKEKEDIKEEEEEVEQQPEEENEDE